MPEGNARTTTYTKNCYFITRDSSLIGIACVLLRTNESEKQLLSKIDMAGQLSLNKSNLRLIRGYSVLYLLWSTLIKL